MNRIIEGIRQFQRDVFPANRELFARLATGQKPEVLFIACSDSRVSLEWITQSGPGELFVCRNAGNMVPRGNKADDVSATIEYAVTVLGVRDIVVKGHSDCGAMKALLHPEALTDLPHVRTWIRQADEARQGLDKAELEKPTPETLEKVTKLNVRLQMDRLSAHPKVHAKLLAGELDVHGWYYKIATGEIQAWQPGEHEWVAVQDALQSLPARLPKVVVGHA